MRVLSAFALGGVLCATTGTMLAQAGGAQTSAPAAAQTGQKTWKDRAEYDLFESARTDASPQSRLDKLNQWKEKYPATDFSAERRALLLTTFAALNKVPDALSTASEVLASDPKDFTALYYITLLTPQVPALTKNPASDDQLSQAEKAANSLLNGGLDAQFATDKKPTTVTDDQWKKARTDIEAVAHTTLGWTAWQRKQFEPAEGEFKKSLAINPNNGDVDYWLGTVIASEKKPEKQAEALFYFARAAAYDGPGALNPQGRTQVLTYVTNAYTKYHGSKEGLDQLLQAAKTNAAAPPNFAIRSVVDLEKDKLAKEQEMAKQHPDLALWQNLKGQLQAADGDKYFESGMKGALLPGDAVPSHQFTGKLVSSEPETRPKTLVLSIEGDKPDVTLKLDSPLPGKADAGTAISFSGIAESYTKDPFMVTFNVEKKNIGGWPGKAEPPARKAPVRRPVRRR